MSGKPLSRTSLQLQRLWRGPGALVVLFAVGFIGILGYASATRTAPTLVAENPTPAAKPEAEPAATPPPNDTNAAAAVPAPADGPPTEDAAESSDDRPLIAAARWISDTTGDDANKRALAITRLADAPKAQALPALQNVLESGEPRVDRPLAIKSLQALAVKQGDADGAIRDVLRGAIYHGDDEETTKAAQTAVSEIDNDPAANRGAVNSAPGNH